MALYEDYDLKKWNEELKLKEMKSMKRSEKEINDFCDDAFGFRASAALECLSFEVCKNMGWLIEDATVEDWHDISTPLEAMQEYIEFALDKCENERGISAGRSVQKMTTWAFLMGDDEAVAFLEDDNNYAPYGRPCLNYVIDRYTLSMGGRV